MRKIREESYTVFDLETTGGRPEISGIMEIGMVNIRGGKPGEKLSLLINPGFPIPPIVEKMTGITHEMVAGAPRFESVAGKIADFIGCSMLVVHNGPFDARFLSYHLEKQGLAALTNPLFCTVKMGERLIPEAPNRKLETLAEVLGIPFNGRHRAWGDAEVTARVFLNCLDRLEEKGIRTFGQLVRFMSLPRPQPKKSQKGIEPKNSEEVRS